MPTPPIHRPAPGVGVTFWTADRLGVDDVFTPPIASLLAECAPDIGCVHGGPTRVREAIVPLAARLRDLVPHIRLQVGIGCDVWLDDVVHGRESQARAVDAITAAVDVAAAQEAEAVILDAEAACKLDSKVTARFFRALIPRLRDRHPALILGHTAFDHPTLHHDDADGVYDDRRVIDEYAWRAFLDEHGVDWEVRQLYGAPEQVQGRPPMFAAPGTLRGRLASSDRSFARAMALGWIRRDVPVDLYLQLHHVPFAQTCTIGAESDVVMGWCAPRLPRGRMDDSGAWALRGLCAMQRAGIRRPGGIREFQMAHGLVVDRPVAIAGRQVLGALGVRVPAGVP